MVLGEYYSSEEYKRINSVVIYFSIFMFIVGTAIFYAPFLFKITGIEWLMVVSVPAIKYVKKAVIIKIATLLLSVSAILTHKPNVTISKEKKSLAGLLSIIGFLGYTILMIFEIFWKVNGGLALFLNILFFGIFFQSGLIFRRRESEDLLTDRRNEEGLELDQHRECVEWNCSINIPYSYRYLGQERLSWINIVNPFRGTLVGGTPGSGKSFAIIEEYMRQCIKKGFTGLIYDFKFPVLATKTWNYLNWYQNTSAYVLKPSFYTLNFDDPEYSHRCNPLSRKRLKTIEDSNEAIKVLMLGINKTWVEKEGEFFTDSANVYASVLSWYLKLVSDKYDYNLSSLPHLIMLSTFESTELLFLIFQEYDDLKAKMRPFAEALANGALEQLAGQVSSAGIALSKITSPNMSYILSGNDFDFELNDPSAPKILCIGNNEARFETYSPALGLILTTVAKAMNQDNRQKSMFFVDEFPTVFFRGVDQLIATARSRLVNVLLGFQTFAQIKKNYGDKEADNIVKLCGTRITGQLFDDDATKMSETIGRQKVLTKNFTYSKDDVTENQATALESIIPPERIAQFSQGTFCGVVADDLKYPEPNKIIFGKVLPPLKIKKEEDKLKIPKVREFISEKEREQKTKEYLDNNFDFVNQFIEMLSSKSFVQWSEIMSKNNQKDLLDNYMIENFVFHRKRLQDFTKLIDFEFSFRELVNKEIQRVDREYKMNEEIKKFFNQCYSKEQWQPIVNEWINKGFKMEAIAKYTANYQSELYNECYLLIVNELRDLQIFEKAERKKRMQYISYLERLIKSNSFKNTCSKNTKREYEKLIVEVKDFTQKEEERLKQEARMK